MFLLMKCHFYTCSTPTKTPTPPPTPRPSQQKKSFFYHFLFVAVCVGLSLLCLFVFLFLLRNRIIQSKSSLGLPACCSAAVVECRRWTGRCGSRPRCSAISKIPKKIIVFFLLSTGHPIFGWFTLKRTRVETGSQSLGKLPQRVHTWDSLRKHFRSKSKRKKMRKITATRSTRSRLLPFSKKNWNEWKTSSLSLGKLPPGFTLERLINETFSIKIKTKDTKLWATWSR